jgi:arginyl-tRNA synthetase
VREVLDKGDRFGESDLGSGKTVLVEYSSPNIAKPFGVGHLRSTVIGNSLRRIFKKLGYHTVGMNFLGDWGTQFGKMIVAYRKWGTEATDKSQVSDLLELYVRFHDVAERDESLNEQAREAFKKLEEGDPEMTRLWQEFKTVSMAEFERIYDILGVQYDEVTSEAFLNDKMEAVLERLKKDGLTEISQGALVIDLKDPQLPPCLLRKADGATLYATRDITGLIYRWNKYRFVESLYVVGSSQADHFKQAFKAIEMMEEAESLPPEDRMTGKVKHIPFGWVKFGEQTMSTRRGNIILLEEVIDRAVALARDKIEEKNPDLKKIEETASMIGVGAVIFSQLSVRRVKDVNFIWEEVLSFEGETGPYLQYTHARLSSLLRNFTGQVTADIDIALLNQEEELRVIEILADYSAVIVDSATNYEPNFIATYLLKLSGAFNKFYQRKDQDGRIDKIISDNADLTAARIALVKAVQIVIKDGLNLLGLKAPEEM